MSLYDAERTVDVHAADKLLIAHSFLHQLRQWAVDREIPKLARRLGEEATVADAVKMQQWTTWRDFVDHALHELEDGTLDHWFADPPSLTDGSGPATD